MYRLAIIKTSVVLLLVVSVSIAGSIASGSDGDTTTPNDPLFGASEPSHLGQWGLRQIHAEKGWHNSTGVGAIIAVVDSGIDLNHEDLKGKADRGKTFLDCGENGCLNGDWKHGDDPHGTHVAGIAAAATNNGEGVAGTAPAASVLAVKVTGTASLLDLPCFSKTFADVARGIRWSADQGADVINLSLGHPVPGLAQSCTVLSPAVSEAIKHAQDKGVVVVAAAGNETFPVCTGPPAFTRGVLCVTATDSREAPADYSNAALKHEQLAVAAPGGGTGDLLFCGGGILSTVPAGQGNADVQEFCEYPKKRNYDDYMGTSMAAPHVSGVAALLAAQGCTAEQMVKSITTTARHPVTGVRGVFSPSYGYGIVDAGAATDKAKDICASSTRANTLAGKL